jgi:hypothetical protein
MRSGTTLLRLMLDHHPQVCVFGEFEYAVRWIRDGQPPLLPEYYRLLESDRVFRDDHFRIDRDLDYASLLRSFLDQAAVRAGKPMVGATVHSNFHELPAIWPDARFVHIVRDPRDVARSSIDMGWVGNVWYGVPYWRGPIQRWKTLQNRVPSQQLFHLRYEDLIADPAGKLTAICQFLGLPYDAAMLSYPEDTSYQAPDPRFTQQWRRKLSDDEVRWVESACGELMEEFDYEPVHRSANAPSPWRRVQLALHHRSARVQFNVQRYGWPRYLRWQLAKRLPASSWRKRVMEDVEQVDRRHLK